VKIHQLNVQYLPEQDRLLARVNTSTGLEFRLWLTRRLTIGLFPLLQKVSSDQLQRTVDAEPVEPGITAKDPKIREFLAEFKKEQAFQQADFKTPYKAPAPHAPIDEPLLVTEVQMTPLSNGQVALKFTAKAPEAGKTRELKMALDTKMMHGLLHLLSKSLSDSKWGQSALTEAQADAPANAMGAPNRPHYLN
jgi:hypothetical protein